MCNQIDTGQQQGQSHPEHDYTDTDNRIEQNEKRGNNHENTQRHRPAGALDTHTHHLAGDADGHESPEEEPPERYRIRFEQTYGDPVELIKEKCMKNRLKIDEAARIFFEDYRYDKAGELVSLTEPKKAEYTINASVLNELISILNDREGYRKALGGSTKKVWVGIVLKAVFINAG